jgi:methionine biosynthesis protein MetW
MNLRSSSPSANSTESAPAPRYRRNSQRYGTHEVILRNVPPGTRVLDVGCATGYLGEALNARGCRVWGVDRDAAALTVAAPWYEDVSVIDLEACDTLPWPERSFDVVLAADVVEHLRDPGRALRVLRNYVRSDGRIVVSVPNVAHASVRIPLLLGRFAYRPTGILDETHLRFLTFKTAHELVESSGFDVQRLLASSNHFGALLQVPGARRLLRGILGYNCIVVATRSDQGLRRHVAGSGVNA